MQAPIDPAEKFADNWAYLKTELNWLDRVLTLAVARQRKDAKEIDRIAQSRADRITSHWWKGVISLDSETAYDEHRKPPQTSPVAKLSYQQQLETRIRASQQQGVGLALPLLCDRLGLTSFEKSLILLSLAPEVNRRYARFYRYLQDEPLLKTDLPSVDLVMRLFCRNDQEWRFARSRLAADAPLRKLKLLELRPIAADTLLNRIIKLSDTLIDYLLAEQPTVQALDRLTLPGAGLLRSERAAIDWSALILPEGLRSALRQMALRVQIQPHVVQQWRLRPATSGTTALLTGAQGTGKTLAARAIAHALDLPLVSADLALVSPGEEADLLAAIESASPGVLLLQSAHCWFGRSAALPDPVLAHFLDQRRQSGLTLLEARSDRPIRPVWQQQVEVMRFSLPSRGARLQLWQQAFPPQLPLAVDWQQLVPLALSGGEIEAIAAGAIGRWTVSGEPQLTLAHIQQAMPPRGGRC